VGRRRIQRQYRPKRVPHYGRTLALILIGVGAPMFAGLLLVVRDTRPDLSDLRSPEHSAGNDPALLGWAGLAHLTRDGAQVKMLGYMMDGYQFVNDGSPAAMFILLPNAGHFLHPAHRDPDEMVEVWPHSGKAVFKDRQLVWVTGRMIRLKRNPRGDQALYALRDAFVVPAAYDDIAKWQPR
jgi:hypothetical protein